MTKFYSKQTGSFYASELRAKYEAAETWPEDAVEVTDAEELAIRSSVNPPLTASQLQAAAIAANEHAIQSALDAKAQSRGYRSITSACAYAAPTQVIQSTDPTFATCEKFRLEGNALQSYMMRTWATACAYLATVEAGTNPMPTPEQAVAMMPTFTWPD